MQEKFYSADHHFFHRSMMTLSPDTRPFSSMEDMHDALIQAHNSRVLENSTDVYILGDFAVNVKEKDEKALRRVFDKLKGRKHLIMGNHDNQRVLQLPWSSVKPWTTVRDGDNSIYLQHCATISWPGMYNNHYHFYGHTHGKLPSHGRSIDVGVDSWDLMPMTANEIIERIHAWNPDVTTYWPERRTIITSASENADDDPYIPEMRSDPVYGQGPR